MCGQQVRAPSGALLTGPHRTQLHGVLNKALLLLSPLQRLEDELRTLHSLRASQPEVFRAAYEKLSASAEASVELADFEGYGLRHCGQPTALHFAAGCGCLEVCVALLARCGRLNFATDAAGQTPLIWAAESGLCATAQVLLDKGADAEHADIEGSTALHLAAGNGCPQLCRILLAAAPAAIVDARTKHGLTPLHLAAKSGHADVALLLLEAGARPAAMTSQKRTALHLAALEGNSTVVNQLLMEDPTVHSVLDCEGMRALDYARERGWTAAANSLSDEAAAHRHLCSEYRLLFEPPCRSLLNTSALEAFLEVGAPSLLGPGRDTGKYGNKSLRLMCRVVDKFDLVDRWAVQIWPQGQTGPFAAVSLRPSQVQPRTDKPIRDVELRLPRQVLDGTLLWSPGLDCRVRSICTLVPEAAESLGVKLTEIRSTWSMPLHL
eukprot:TRINITY_DN41407_c0_g1_i1.p1 TRINITY_DN41407_c0_g1~~TRINITY_DN41407_c0_g1_i1.p1  ORF type:complete len:437 (+),score=81.65 TRINITY_DN41407_c0_g1_i1:49-1359(+)